MTPDQSRIGRAIAFLAELEETTHDARARDLAVRAKYHLERVDDADVERWLAAHCQACGRPPHLCSGCARCDLCGEGQTVATCDKCWAYVCEGCIGRREPQHVVCVVCCARPNAVPAPSDAPPEPEEDLPSW